MNAWRPWKTAAADQALSAADSELDRLIAGFRAQTTAHGDLQGTASVTLALTRMPQARTAGIAVTALRRLARAGDQGPAPAREGVLAALARVRGLRVQLQVEAGAARGSVREFLAGPVDDELQLLEYMLGQEAG